MVQVQVSDDYIQFALMYTTDYIFHVLPIKKLVNKNGEPPTPHKLETGTKTSVSNLSVLFCPFFIQKTTSHVDKKALNMRHKSQKVSWHNFWNTTTSNRAPCIRT